MIHQYHMLSLGSVSIWYWCIINVYWGIILSFDCKINMNRFGPVQFNSLLSGSDGDFNHCSSQGCCRIFVFSAYSHKGSIISKGCYVIMFQFRYITSVQQLQNWYQYTSLRYSFNLLYVRVEMLLPSCFILNSTSSFILNALSELYEFSNCANGFVGTSLVCN